MAVAAFVPRTWVAAIREIGKTGGFEDFEIQTGPSEVTSVSSQVVLHASCTSESYSRMYNQLINVYRYCNAKTLSSVGFVWFLVLETRKRPLCRRCDPASLNGKHNMTPCWAPRPVQKQNPQFARCLVAASRPGLSVQHSY